MRRLPFVCAIAGAALLLTTTSAVADDPPADIGIITGSLSFEGGQVAPGSVVAERVDDQSATFSQGIIGDPRYVLRVPPGRYRVWYSPSVSEVTWEYFPSVHTQTEAAIITVEEGQTSAGIDFDLESTAGTILGTVRGARPMPSHGRFGALVIPYYLDGDVWRPVPARGTYGGASPDFRLEGLPPGTYRLRYEKRDGGGDTSSGFLGGAEGGDDVESATPVEVRTWLISRFESTVRKGAVLTGRVVDDSRRPVAGAEVTTLRRYASGWSRGTTVRTDARGRYTIPRLDGAAYVLEVVPPSPYDRMFSGDVHRDVTMPFEEPSAPDEAVAYSTTAASTSTVPDQLVERSGTLRGTIVDLRVGRPVPGVRVSVAPVRTVDSSTIQHGTPIATTTDALGRYSFGRLPRGPYRLTLEDPWAEHQTEYRGGTSINPVLHPDDREHVVVTSATDTVVDVEVSGYPPTLSDLTPVVGQELSALPPPGGRDETPEGATWTWRRSGEVIAGATSSRYRVTPADHGERLTADLTVTTDEGPVTQTSPPSARVSSARPAVTLSASSPSTGRVTLAVRGTAPDLPTSLLDGTVEIVHHNTGRRTTRTMVDGALTTSLTGQPKGIQTYTVRFLAQPDRFAASPLGQRTVTVR